MTRSPSLMAGDLPSFVPIFALNSGGARPFEARGEETSLYGSFSSSSSQAIRIAREAPRKYRVMSDCCAIEKTRYFKSLQGFWKWEEGSREGKRKKWFELRGLMSSPSSPRHQNLASSRVKGSSSAEGNQVRVYLSDLQFSTFARNDMFKHQPGMIGAQTAAPS